jgi:predicted aspartyl protease
VSVVVPLSVVSVPFSQIPSSLVANRKKVVKEVGGDKLKAKSNNNKLIISNIRDDNDEVLTYMFEDDDTCFEVNLTPINIGFQSINTSDSKGYCCSNPHKVLVEIGGKSVIAVVDTGAAVTLIDRRILHQLESAEMKKEPYVGPVLVGAGGIALKVKNVNHLKFKLGGKEFQNEFIDVVDLKPSILLGADFLCKQGIITIDYEEGWMRFGGVTVHFLRHSVTYPNFIGSIQKESSDELEPELVFSREDPHGLLEMVSKVVENSKNLATYQRQQLKSFLEKNIKTFAPNPNKPGTAMVTPHEIFTEGATPVRQRPYRVAEFENSPQAKAIEEMLKNGIIRESSSDWASPVIMVKKKDGSLRFCVDFRKLNALTKKDSYPLPLIEDLLNNMGKSKAKYFSKLDLASGYWQIPVAEKDIPKTAFITPAGLYEFVVMAFGLTNAPATFQRGMDKLFRGLDKFCLVYLDDIIIFSPTIEKHFEDIQLVFDRLQNAGYHAKLKKCEFLLSEISFLGHVVSEKGIAADPEKIEMIKTMVPPSNVRSVREFLGLTGFYRRFIKDYSHLAKPLHSITHKDVPFQWSKECQNSFELLKEKLISSPVLVYPDFSKPFTLECDASGSAIGLILSQDSRVVAYGGRVFKPSEQVYPATQREALAVVYGCRKFRSLILGRPFVVLTDHNPLVHLMKVKDPNGMLMRWSMELQEYEITPVYRSGPSSGNVDCLSRCSCWNTVAGKPEILAVLQVPEEVKQNPSEVDLLSVSSPDHQVFVVQVDEEDQVPSRISNLAQLQREDRSLSPYFDFLETQEYPENTKTARDLALTIENYALDEFGVLCFLPPNNNSKNRFVTKWRVVVPKSLRSDILLSYHDEPMSGHLGVAKTFHKIRQRFYWKGMSKDINHYVRSCEKCSKKKHPKTLPKGHMGSVPVAQPFQLWAYDVTGPFPTTDQGNKYIHVLTEYFTRYVETAAAKTQDAVTTAQIFNEKVICRHGVPETLLTDRGKNFNSQLVKELCKFMGIHKKNTTSYHPQTDALPERFNSTLVNMLAKFVSDNQKDWDVYLSHVTFAYNTSNQESTGDSPYFLMYGREPILPLDNQLHSTDSSEMFSSVSEYRTKLISVLEEARRLAIEHTQKAHMLQKDRYDSQHINTQFIAGERVWLFTPNKKKGLSPKLMSRWSGPYRITRKIGDLNYMLTDDKNKKMKQFVHVNRLKEYIERKIPVIDPKLSEDDQFDFDLEAEDFKNVEFDENPDSSTVEQSELRPSSEGKEDMRELDSRNDDFLIPSKVKRPRQKEVSFSPSSSLSSPSSPPSSSSSSSFSEWEVPPVATRSGRIPRSIVRTDV